MDAGPFCLNLNCGSLLDFCACHGLSITNTMLKHDAGTRAPLAKVIDFIIVSSNLRLYVLDTWVKRGASQATDYQFRWEWKPQDRCGKRVVRVNWEGVEDAAVCEAPPAELLLYSCGSLGTSNQNG